MRILLEVRADTQFRGDHSRTVGTAPRGNINGIRGRHLLSSKTHRGPIRDRDCYSTIPSIKKDSDKYSSKGSPSDNGRWISRLYSNEDGNEAHKSKNERGPLEPILEFTFLSLNAQTFAPPANTPDLSYPENGVINEVLMSKRGETRSAITPVPTPEFI